MTYLPFDSSPWTRGQHSVMYQLPGYRAVTFFCDLGVLLQKVLNSFKSGSLKRNLELLHRSQVHQCSSISLVFQEQYLWSEQALPSMEGGRPEIPQPSSPKQKFEGTTLQPQGYRASFQQMGHVSQAFLWGGEFSTLDYPLSIQMIHP